MLHEKGNTIIKTTNILSIQ